MLQDVGGYDERFQSWGGDDDAMACALSTLAGPPVQLDRIAWLLWHKPVVIDRQKYATNLALLARYEAAAGDPVAMRALISDRLPLDRYDADVRQQARR
jgi:hypothetical protein